MPETILTPAIQTIREQIVVAAHHPNRLRRPPVRPGAVEADRYRQTLLRNIFRTFELLPPAFWLRRLQASSTEGGKRRATTVADVSRLAAGRHSKRKSLQTK